MASPSKVSGMKLGAEPRKVVLLAVLLVIVVGVVIYNRQSGISGETTSSGQVNTPTPAVPAANGSVAKARTRPVRKVSSARDRGALRIQPVDPRSGDVDPTLRLDLLARLQAIQPLSGGRSLFEMGSSAAQMKPLPVVKIVPKPLTGPGVMKPPVPPQPVFNIPLKFYGFMKPKNKAGSNSGFFLDGDKILVATEGELLKQRYLVVELTPGSAKLEDVQQKKGQTLPLVPEARNEF